MPAAGGLVRRGEGRLRPAAHRGRQLSGRVPLAALAGAGRPPGSSASTAARSSPPALSELRFDGGRVMLQVGTETLPVSRRHTREVREQLVRQHRDRPLGLHRGQGPAAAVLRHDQGLAAALRSDQIARPDRTPAGTIAGRFSTRRPVRRSARAAPCLLARVVPSAVPHAPRRSAHVVPHALRRAFPHVLCRPPFRMRRVVPHTSFRTRCAAPSRTRRAACRSARIRTHGGGIAGERSAGGSPWSSPENAFPGRRNPSGEPENTSRKREHIPGAGKHILQEPEPTPWKREHTSLGSPQARESTVHRSWTTVRRVDTFRISTATHR